MTRFFVATTDHAAVLAHLMHDAGLDRCGWADVPGGHVFGIWPRGDSDRAAALSHPAVKPLPHPFDPSPLAASVTALFPHVTLTASSRAWDLFTALHAAGSPPHPLLDPNA